MTKDVISLSISVLLLFRHYISHKITFGAPSSGGVLCSACGAFICKKKSFRKISECQRVWIQSVSLQSVACAYPEGAKATVHDTTVHDKL